LDCTTKLAAASEPSGMTSSVSEITETPLIADDLDGTTKLEAASEPSGMTSSVSEITETPLIVDDLDVTTRLAAATEPSGMTSSVTEITETPLIVDDLDVTTRLAAATEPSGHLPPENSLDAWYMRDLDKTTAVADPLTKWWADGNQIPDSRTACTEDYLLHTRDDLTKAHPTRSGAASARISDNDVNIKPPAIEGKQETADELAHSLGSWYSAQARHHSATDKLENSLSTWWADGQMPQDARTSATEDFLLHTENSCMAENSCITGKLEPKKDCPDD